MSPVAPAAVADHPLFAGMDPAVTATVAAATGERTVATGGLVIEEGAAADALFLVRRGRVSIEVHAPGRGPLVVEVVGPGGAVGWSWLVPPHRWVFDGRALEPVDALAVDAATLRALLEAEPQAGVELLRRLAGSMLRQLQGARLRMVDLYGRGAP